MQNYSDSYRTNQRALALALAFMLGALTGSATGAGTTPAITHGTAPSRSPASLSSPLSTPAPPPTPTANPTRPTITSQPASQMVDAGQNATFTVTAAGTAPLAYAWLKHGNTIVGATQASYSTPVLSTADNGESFAAVVTSAMGTVTSRAALLEVRASLTATRLTASANPVADSQVLTLTAHVIGGIAGTRSGTVTFLDGTDVLGSRNINGSEATLASSSLSAGVHSLTVRYSGDANDSASTSAPLMETVSNPTDRVGLTCAASPTTAVQGTLVQVTATGTSTQGGPMTYAYASSAGTISGTTSTAIFDSAAAPPGSVSVTCTVRDDQGQTATASATLTIVAVAPNSFYVATTGDDSAAGDAAHPFLTLDRAQSAMRGSSSKTTQVAAGTYYLSNTLALTAADQGETIKAVDGARAVLSGGHVLAGWQGAGNGVYTAVAANPVGLDLTIAGKRQTAADLGWDPERPTITGWRVVDPNMTRTLGTTISVLSKDLTASVKAGATVQVLSDLRYSDNFTTIVSVNAANHTITLGNPFNDGAAGGSSGHSASWRVLNDPADLAVAGQFAYDKASGVVYLMPQSPGTLGTDAVVAASLTTLISLSDVSGVTISGLTFSDTVSPTGAYSDVWTAQTATVYASGMSNSTLSNNTFVNAGNGVGLTGSSGNAISGNTFSAMGGSGVMLVSGSNGNRVTSNTMIGLGKVNAGTTGVHIADSSSNTIDGNTIDGSGRWGIDVYPSDNVQTKNDVISNNEIRNTSQQTNDTGAIYAWAGSVPSGVNAELTITGNRIENTGGLDRDGSGNYGQQGWNQGIYLDDHLGGVTMTKNVIETGGFGIFLCHGCTGATASNNLIVIQPTALYNRGANGTSTATQDMNYNGTATFDLLPSYFPAAANPSVIVLQLSGTSAAGVGAHFNVLADGNVVGTGTATATVTDFTFTTALAAHTHHQIGVQLDNGADTGAPTKSLHDIVLFVNTTAVVPQNSPAAFHRVGSDDLLTSDISITRTIMGLGHGVGQDLLDYTPSYHPGYLDPHPGTIDYNLLYQQVAKAVDSSFGSQPLDAHTIIADPLFADAGIGDYSLQPASPAFGIGFATDGVPLTPRP